MTVDTLLVTIIILIIILLLIISPASIQPAILAASLVAILLSYKKLSKCVLSNMEPFSKSSTEKMSSESVKKQIQPTDDLDTDDIDIIKSDKKFDHSDILDSLFKEPEPPKDGDQQLYESSVNQSEKSKQSILNRSRMNSQNLAKYFQEELDEQENRVWFENDILDAFM